MTLSDTPQQFHKDISSAVSYLNSLGLDEVYLFGSLAKNEATNDSDIDIAVRGIQPKDFFTVYGELLMRLSHPVDLIDLDLQSSFGEKLANSGELKRVYL